MELDKPDIVKSASFPPEKSVTVVRPVVAEFSDGEIGTTFVETSELKNLEMEELPMTEVLYEWDPTPVAKQLLNAARRVFAPRQSTA